MFGLGSKRKTEENYDEAYAYDEYDYDESYDSYDDYEGYGGYDTYDEEQSRPVRRNRGKKMTPNSYEEPRNETARIDPRMERPEEDHPSVKLQELQQEILRLEENTQRLTAQLEVKQGELTRLTQLLSEKESQGKTSVQEALRKEEQAKDEAAEWKRQARQQEDTLAEVQRTHENELAELTKRLKLAEEQARHQDVMKSDLANIIIETKEQGRDIVERAQWEADRIRERAEIDARKIVADASLELRVVKQEATQYRERVLVMKEESSQLFEKLLTSSEQLAQLE